MKEKCLYESLVNIVGTQTDIRTRQRLFIIKDVIYNVGSPEEPYISSGSLAEGFDLSGSDVDVMFVWGNVNVLRNVRDIKQQIHRTTLVMETDTDHPRFTRLRLIGEAYGYDIISSQCLFRTDKCVYVSVNGFNN